MRVISNNTAGTVRIVDPWIKEGGSQPIQTHYIGCIHNNTTVRVIWAMTMLSHLFQFFAIEEIRAPLSLDTHFSAETSATTITPTIRTHQSWLAAASL